jgi:hypothetical protein
VSDPLDVLFQSIVSALSGASAIWEDRVSPEYIKDTDTRPAVVYTHVGGGEDNDIRLSDPTYVIDVQCVAANSNEDPVVTNANRKVLDAASEITRLLDNQGSQDVDNDRNPTATIVGDDSYVITTITQGIRIHNVGNLENGQPVYNSGHEFTITMEEL